MERPATNTKAQDFLYPYYSLGEDGLKGGSSVCTYTWWLAYEICVIKWVDHGDSWASLWIRLLLSGFKTSTPVHRQNYTSIL